VKAILIAAAFSAVLIAPALAEQTSLTLSRQGWTARQHVYAAEYYARQSGNNNNTNNNPDRQLVRD
jgi:hypothetical protein